MKTPHAILIGLSLISAAIFFKDTAVKPAHAFGGPDYITCWSWAYSYVFEGDTAHWINMNAGANAKDIKTINWRTGKIIR